MTIDLSQFHQVFFDESFEGLDTMEQLLLTLGSDADSESVNTIFRSAHSIKGGSATFGFTKVSEFTHVLETLLDGMRSGQREFVTELTNLLLQSVDCLRQMLNSLQEDGECDNTIAEELAKQFLALDNSESVSPETTASKDKSESSTSSTIVCDEWQINFFPEPQILCNGNEPIRLFRELAELGECEVQMLGKSIPVWNEFEPDQLFLQWKIHLKASVTEEQIRDVFEWVVDECELTIIAKKVPATLQVPNELSTSNPQLSKSTAVVKQAKSRQAVTQNTTSIRVGIEKVDSLINLVGELVITQSMLSQVGTENDAQYSEKLRLGLAQLEQNTRELQESVMEIRMMPISFVFNRFPRMVRDTALKLNKNIKLKISGENTELDKSVMERIGDPLVHLVRNSLDHGIESPEERLSKGKSETGTISLEAYHQGGSIMIEINDDGQGINSAKVFAKAVERGLVSADDNLSDTEIFNLLFQPGFTTAEVVTDVSGRGVGMDVVKKNVNLLGGSIDVFSEPDEGSTFRIRLPLTLAILEGQLIRVGEEIFVVPLMSVLESLQVDDEKISCVGGQMDLYRLREDYLPIIDVADEFGIKTDKIEIDESILVVVEGDNQKIGLQVDELLTQQQVVIKSIDTHYKPIQGISGATILGDGRVALILDIVGFIRHAKENRDG